MPDATLAKNLLARLWDDYIALNPGAGRIAAMIAARGETIVNDHIAFRTLAGQNPITGIASLSRLNVRRHAASPTPFDSNKRSRMSSLSIRGRLSAGANRRAKVVFPLAGRPEITTKGLCILSDPSSPHYRQTANTEQGLTHTRRAQRTTIAACVWGNANARDRW